MHLWLIGPGNGNMLESIYSVLYAKDSWIHLVGFFGSGELHNSYHPLTTKDVWFLWLLDISGVPVRK